MLVWQVRRRVLKEFAYQSSLELDDATFAKLDSLPLASDIQLRFRQNLARELEEYQVGTGGGVDAGLGTSRFCGGRLFCGG